MPSMIHGGMGIQGIAQTDFFQFINSPDGLSQLGIPPTEPSKLLEAYAKSTSVVVLSEGIQILFGDVAKIELFTPHPAAGVGQLEIRSWMEWVFDEKTEDAGFVSRQRIESSSGRGGSSQSLRDAIRLSPPLGGLMLPTGQFGSTGFWQFPPELVDFESEWLTRNLPVIQQLVSDQFSKFITVEFGS